MQDHRPARSSAPRQEDEGVEAGAVAHCHHYLESARASTIIDDLHTPYLRHGISLYLDHSGGTQYPTRNRFEPQPGCLQPHEADHRATRHQSRGDKGEHPGRAVIAHRRWCASEPPLESRIKPARRVGPSRGTDGSHPSPSTGESDANLTSGAHSLTRTQRVPVRRRETRDRGRARVPWPKPSAAPNRPGQLSGDRAAGSNEHNRPHARGRAEYADGAATSGYGTRTRGRPHTPAEPIAAPARRRRGLTRNPGQDSEPSI
jgi:hypothetical protein